MSDPNILEFEIGINRLYPGEKLPQGDPRWGEYTRAFHQEVHRVDSLIELVNQGFAFSPVMRDSHRSQENFLSAQHVGLDSDTGDAQSSLETLAQDPFISDNAAFLYTTHSSTPEHPKARIVLILDHLITDRAEYRLAQQALAWKYEFTDHSVAEESRFFYGAPGCAVVKLGQVLTLDVLQQQVIGPYLAYLREQADSVKRIPHSTALTVMGLSRAERYANRAVQEEVAWLSSRQEGTGQRHLGLLIAAMKLESLRHAEWLPAEVREGLDPYSHLLAAARANGYVAKYGETATRRTIADGIRYSVPRPKPASWKGASDSLDPDPKITIGPPHKEEGAVTPQDGRTVDMASGKGDTGWEPRFLMDAGEVATARALDSLPRRYLAYASQRTDAPLEFLEASAYAGLSVVVGRKAQLILATGPVIPTLWVMLVADSTRYRKSTTIDLIGDVLQRAGLDVFAPDDFSPQRLINLMAERSGKATLFRRDEFGGFYEGLNKLEHQAGGKQVLINFHDGHDYRKELVGQKQVDKRTGGVTRKAEVIEVKDPFLSILAGTQRDLFLSQAQPSDIYSGFLARWVYIVPEGLPTRKDVEELDPSIEIERDNLVAEVRELDNAPLRKMRLAQGVLPRWNRYTADLDEEAEAAPLPSIAGPVFARIGGTAFKVALRLGYAEGDVVTMEHLLAGMEVAERWRRQTYALLAAIGPTRDEKIVQRVFDLVQRKPGIKRGAIMSALRLSARGMEAARETLVQREWLREVPDGRGVAYYPMSAAGSLATLERLQGSSFMKEPPGGVWSQGHYADAGKTALGESPGPKPGPSKRSSVASDEVSAASNQGDVGEV
jgi:hypothetical protein